MQIVLATHRPEKFKMMRDRLAMRNVDIRVAKTEDQLLGLIAKSGCRLVIADEGFGSRATVQLLESCLQANAFIHTAVVTNLDPETFHNQYEGYGVLTALPFFPGIRDTDRLLETIFKIDGLMSQSRSSNLLDGPARAPLSGEML